MSGLSLQCRKSGLRRGSVYLAALGVAMLVTLIGLSGVLATRVGWRNAALTAAALQADTAAQSLMDVVLYRLTHDLYWRSHYQNDTWTAFEICGDGVTGSFKLVDELDGDLANNASQPARLYCRATVGEAMRMYSIVFTAVPPQTNNLLNNPGMESGAANWKGDRCTLAVAKDTSHSGGASLKATARDDHYAGPAQTVSGFLASGQSYEVEAWVKTDTGTADAKLVLYCNGLLSLSTYYAGGTTTVNAGSWTRLSATLTPSWSGTLLDAYLKINTTSGTVSFYVDDVIMRKAGTGRDAELTPMPGTFRREVLAEPAASLMQT
ncbi:MAG: carbohydrate binding domain-containing protein [Phycisphaerae bacterium]|jgi:hypothetical protein|nr:carbohydrate binding domain-containing protein [Phycisphaerae bacterium]HPC21661.1 carbohydrate binding domain-containing protein [Phycisphaerae bacterium]